MTNVDVKVIVSAWPCVTLCNTVTIDIDIFMFFYQIKYYFFTMKIKFFFRLLYILLNMYVTLLGYLYHYPAL